MYRAFMCVVYTSIGRDGQMERCVTHDTRCLHQYRTMSSNNYTAMVLFMFLFSYICLWRPVLET